MAEVDVTSNVDEREIVDCAKRLIRIPSLSGKEAAVAVALADELRRIGFEEVSVDAKNNVIGWLNGTGSGPTLMLNGHIDHAAPGTMPDPYEAIEMDGSRWGKPGRVIYGRAAVDMKGAIASMAGAGGAVRRSGRRLRGNVVFVANTFEEVSTAEGINYVFDHDGVRADMAVNGEATDLQIYLGHRGMMEVKVTAKGRTSHASNPSRGVNAIFKMNRFIETLETQYEVPKGHFLGDCSTAVIDITASPGRLAPIVPDRCSLHIDRRFLPGETPEKIRSEIEGLIDKTRARDPEFSADVEILKVFPSLYCPPSERVVQALKAARKRVMGDEGPLSKWIFGTDGAYIAERGVPCVGFGPGNELYAHTPEDHIAVADLVTAARVYASLIEDVCG